MGFALFKTPTWARFTSLLVALYAKHIVFSLYSVRCLSYPAKCGLPFTWWEHVRHVFYTRLRSSLWLAILPSLKLLFNCRSQGWRGMQTTAWRQIPSDDEGGLPWEEASAQWYEGGQNRKKINNFLQTVLLFSVLLTLLWSIFKVWNRLIGLWILYKSLGFGLWI